MATIIISGTDPENPGKIRILNSGLRYRITLEGWVAVRLVRNGHHHHFRNVMTATDMRYFLSFHISFHLDPLLLKHLHVKRRRRKKWSTFPSCHLFKALFLKGWFVLTNQFVIYRLEWFPKWKKNEISCMIFCW